LLAIVWLGLLICLSSSGQTVIDFEGLADSIIVTNQFLGLVFSGASVLTAGVSLNPTFPPHSGIKVVFDSSTPMTITFTPVVTSVGAFFTYNRRLTLTALNASNTVVATRTSAFTSNVVGSGNPSNEFLQVASGGGIKTLSITSGIANSFVMDDLTVGGVVTVPAVTEPVLIALAVLLASLALFMARRPVRRA
jgi:hypothetical protein